jgi:hypothetical protein
MSSQGEPSSGKADGAWWDAVYEGPDDEVPDTPGADSRQGSVDDWFDSASDVITGHLAATPRGHLPGTGRDTPSPTPGRPDADVSPASGAPGRGPAGAAVDGPSTLVNESSRKPPVVPEQSSPPARPVGRVPAPPPLPPLPIRPPRIPPQAADPRVAPPRASAPGSRPAATDPYVGDRYAADRYDADAYDGDVDPDPGSDSDVYEAVYAEPQVIRTARAEALDREVPDRPVADNEAPDREVRDLDAVRDANAAEAASAANAAAASVPRPAPVPLVPPAPVPARAAAPAPPTAPSPSPVPERTPTQGAGFAAQQDPLPDPAAAEPLPQVGPQPPVYEPEPTALPAADPGLLTGIVPDTALDGARYGTMTLRAASVRGDAARHYGAGRSDRLLTVRFGEGSEALLLVVVATPPSSDNPAPADEACRQLAAAVGRSRAELLADLRVGAQERLRYGLQRLTARAAVRLQNVPYPTRGDDAEGSGGALHALIAPLDPTSRLRAGFGLGPGGLLLLGDDAWYDAYAGRRLVAQQPNGGTPAGSGVPQPPDRFRFRVVAPEPGDVLLLCSDGLAQPLREEPAVSDFLADHWAHPHPPGTVDFLRQVQVRAKGYAADRTAAAIWED